MKETEQKNQIIILGGGQTACFAAEEIRKHDKVSDLLIISNEKYLPYQKPPLSKDCLIGNMKYEECLIYDKNFYINNNIKININETILKIDFKKKEIITDKKKFYFYNKLLIALGSKPNKIENFNHVSGEINYLRDINDSINIKKKMDKSSNILIIGAGFIGLEIASILKIKKKNVTIVESANQILGRTIPKGLSQIIQDYHKLYGVDFNLNSKISNIIKKNENYEIHLDNKKIFHSDLIIAGIGSKPNTDLFVNCDLKIDNGIITNEYCETNIENVYAAGDIANFYHPFFKRYMRLETWKNAQNQGIIAGRNIIGIKDKYDEIPWMWSDQYNLNIQLSGVCHDYDSHVKRGTKPSEGIIYFFIKNRKIIGACGVAFGGKIGRDIKIASKLTKNNISVTKNYLSDTNTKLNKLLQ